MLRLARSSVRYQLRAPTLLHACNRIDAFPRQHQQQRRGIITLCKDKVGKMKPKVAQVLADFCRSANLPPPEYTYEMGESKKPIHTCFVKVPLSREMQMDTGYRALMGRGRARNKKDARILAAMSADFTFQSMSMDGMSISDLAKKVAVKEAEARKKHDEDPLGLNAQSPDWNEMPVDRMFTTGRNNFIDFGMFEPKEAELYSGARAAILSSRNMPQLRILKNMTSEGAKLQANMTIWPGKKAKRQVLISHGEVGDFDHHPILRNLYKSCLQFCHSHRLIPPLIDNSASIGMAVLYPSLSESQAVFLNKSILQLDSEIEADKSEVESAMVKESQRTPSQSNSFSNGKKRVQPSLRQTRASRAFNNSSNLRPLPIDSLKNEFLKIVNDDSVDVVILRGGTGSGKTSRVPAFMQHSLSGARIAVSEPRRVAAQTAAARMASEQGTALGSSQCSVGYAIRFDRVAPTADATARGSTVLFATAGVLLRSRSPNLDQYSHVIVDEAHERDSDTDLLLALVREAVQARRNTDNPLKVVVMSATLDAEAFSDYFGNEELNVRSCSVPDATCFDVEHISLEQLSEQGLLSSEQQQELILAEQTKADEIDGGGRYQYDDMLWAAAADVVKAVCEGKVSADWFKRTVPSTCTRDGKVKGNSILVFLPGREEISRVYRQLELWQGGAQQNQYARNGRYVHQQQHDEGGMSEADLAEKLFAVPERPMQPHYSRNMRYDPASKNSPPPPPTEFDRIDIKNRRKYKAFRQQQQELNQQKQKQQRERLFSGNSRTRPRLVLVPLHASLPSHEQKRAFASVRPDELKVILATNIAESSITIPDVVLVVDCGRERQHRLPAGVDDSVYSSLEVVSISQAAARQRAGRAGRVAPGACVRLYSRKRLESSLPYTQPEMQRMHLRDLVVTCKMLSADKLLARTPSPPDAGKVDRTVGELKQLGVLSNDNEKLTALGDLVASLPVDIRLGRMLALGAVLGGLGTALEMAAILSQSDIFKTRLNRDPNCNSNSDVMEFLYVYRRWLEKPQSMQLEPGTRRFMMQAQRTQRQLSQIMQAKGFVVQSKKSNDKRLGLHIALICCAMQNVAHLVGGTYQYGTRDLPSAYVHPSSVNFSKREGTAFWYMYLKLVQTKRPFMSVTTAVSPVDIALFAASSDLGVSTVRHTGTASNASRLAKVMESPLVIDDWIPVRRMEGDKPGRLLALDPFLNARSMLNKRMAILSQNPTQPSTQAQSDFASILIAIIEHERRDMLAVLDNNESS